MVNPSSTTTTTWSDMDRVLSGSDRKRVVQELLKGRDAATQLQLLLLHPQHVTPPHDHLLLNICNSFSHSLSILNSASALEHRSPPPLASDCPDHRRPRGSGDHPAGRSDRRGCYKRRKNIQRWTTFTTTTEDGRAWRKYGQKLILNSKYPRAYFRCTRKFDQGCGAIKQVQLMEDESRLYNTTYIGVHTCTMDLPEPPQVLSDSEPNYEDRSKLQSTNVCRVKEESKEREDKDGIVIPTDIDSISWPDVLSFDSSQAVSMVYSCTDTSSQSLDMDFGVTSVDFDNFDDNVFL